MYILHAINSDRQHNCWMSSDRLQYILGEGKILRFAHIPTHNKTSSVRSGILGGQLIDSEKLALTACLDLMAGTGARHRPTGKLLHFFFLLARQPPSGPWPPPHSRGFLWFLDHTLRHTTVGWTPLDEWSARRRDLYLKTHNTHNRQKSMPMSVSWSLGYLMAT